MSDKPTELDEYKELFLKLSTRLSIGYTSLTIYKEMRKFEENEEGFKGAGTAAFMLAAGCAHQALLALRTFFDRDDRAISLSRFYELAILFVNESKRPEDTIAILQSWVTKRVEFGKEVQSSGVLSYTSKLVAHIDNGRLPDMNISGSLDEVFPALNENIEKAESIYIKINETLNSLGSCVFGETSIMAPLGASDLGYLLDSFLVGRAAYRNKTLLLTNSEADLTSFINKIKGAMFL